MSFKVDTSILGTTGTPEYVKPTPEKNAKEETMSDIYSSFFKNEGEGAKTDPTPLKERVQGFEGYAEDSVIDVAIPDQKTVKVQNLIQSKL